MRNLLLESGVASCNKYGEDLCGDFISTIEKDDMTTIVLSDGLGSGVKANILSTLTGKILSTLSSHGVSMEESVDVDKPGFALGKTLESFLRGYGWKHGDSFAASA